MAKLLGKINRPFLFWTIFLAVAGFFIFSSASLGVLAKNEVKFSNIAFNQIFFGLLLGSIACVIFARIDYHIWKKYSLFLFVGAIIFTLLVFIPGIGFGHGGAKRWIDFRFVTFQPAELLKLCFVSYFAAWLAAFKGKADTLRHGLVPFLVMSGITGIVLLAQPDTDTFAVMLFAGMAMYIVAGAKWRHLGVIIVGGVAIIAVLALTRPYIRQRIDTMINPSQNTKTISYQLNQSLIAVGSGRVWGRGFGQSVQKFAYLPEPVGDSVFAVAAEEFGFVGAVIILSTFLMWGLSGIKISANAPDEYGRLLSLGIVILMISQAFVNIFGMLGILPLTGITLPFVSQGGTSLFLTLLAAGVVMNISRQARPIKQK